MFVISGFFTWMIAMAFPSIDRNFCHWMTSRGDRPPSLKPLGKIRELHLMLDADIRDGNLNDALLESSNPIAAP